MLCFNLLIYSLRQGFPVHTPDLPDEAGLYIVTAVGW